MTQDRKQNRHGQITDHAYEVLKEKGYAGASLLTIAKAAKASNETLYRWYGNKAGLFAAMVQDNAAEAKERLQAALQSKSEPIATLQAVAPILLGMVVGEKAVLLNRAAAADPSNELGAAIASHGREAIAPLIGDVLSRLFGDKAPNPQKLSETFINLLVGDWQIRRTIGVMPEPDVQTVQQRSAAAIDQMIKLYG